MHLCTGKIDVEENFKVFSNKPTALSVVGGSQVKTEYDSWRFNLGPNDQEEFVEINCVGMDSITSKFNKFDLAEISREYREYTGNQKNQTPLPEYVGGSEVHLLLGIKNTKMQPVGLYIVQEHV